MGSCQLRAVWYILRRADFTYVSGEVTKIRLLLYVLDYVGTLLAFVLVFFGLWRILLTPDPLAYILIVLGVLMGVLSFAISKKLKSKPQAGQERL